MRRRCALLTSGGGGELKDLASDDLGVLKPLAALGWETDFVAWDAVVEWGTWDAVVLRSVWDYHKRLPEFLSAMRGIRAAGVGLANPLPMVEWNANKRYLQDLSAAGVAVIPTEIHSGLPDLDPVMDRLGVRQVVVKPAVGASAFLTYRLVAGEGHAGTRSAIGSRSCLVQPFLPSIRDVGETSLMYFLGTFSHAVGRIPAAGDFRVQEELGGRVEAREPSTEELLLAETALGVLEETPVYARVDIVDGGTGPVLMELELIEPMLYLGHHPEASVRFATAIDRWFADSTR